VGDLWIEFIPVVATIIAVLGGIIGYWRQKVSDRKSDLIKAQQEYHRSYLFSMQRVLTSCVRTDHDARRQSVDDLRSYEAALYVTAPTSVAKQLAPLHIAFFEYTRCIRVQYEARQAQKFGSDYPADKLLELESSFVNEYRTMLGAMRKETLNDSSKIDIELSLASKERANTPPE